MQAFSDLAYGPAGVRAGLPPRTLATWIRSIIWLPRILWGAKDAPHRMFAKQQI